jgi:Trk-type K+ transport system membrane component
MEWLGHLGFIVLLVLILVIIIYNGKIQNSAGLLYNRAPDISDTIYANGTVIAICSSVALVLTIAIYLVYGFEFLSLNKS